MTLFYLKSEDGKELYEFVLCDLIDYLLTNYSDSVKSNTTKNDFTEDVKNFAND